MSSALYIVTERRIPDFDPFVNGKALSATERKLSRLATDLDVTPLMEFFSISPEEAAGFIEDEGGDTDAIDMPDETWFDASDGLSCVNALADHLTQNPASVPDASAVLSDLAEFNAVLSRLQTDGIRWRLAVDY
jgi:hypothetical protein